MTFFSTCSNKTKIKLLFVGMAIYLGTMINIRYDKKDQFNNTIVNGTETCEGTYGSLTPETCTDTNVVKACLDAGCNIVTKYFAYLTMLPTGLSFLYVMCLDNNRSDTPLTEALLPEETDETNGPDADNLEQLKDSELGMARMSNQL